MPVAATIVKSSASAPAASRLHVTAPIARLTEGVGEVQAAFSATVAFAYPLIVKVDSSITLRTVTVIACAAALPSASVAVTVTS